MKDRKTYGQPFGFFVFSANPQQSHLQSRTIQRTTKALQKSLLFNPANVDNFNSKSFDTTKNLTNFVQKLFSMNQKSTFGEIIRQLREENNLPLRKVAAELDLDPSTLSKIERGDRSANKEMVEVLSKLYSVDQETLLISFLSDKVAYELLDEDCSEDVLKVAEEKIKYRRALSTKQQEINF